MRKIELTNEDGKYTIEIEEDIEFIGDYIDYLVRPVLLAAGFQQDNVNEFLGEGQ